MIPASHVLTFALLSFALIIVPGPNVLFVISRSLMLGRAAGVGTALGGQIGVYAQVAAVAFGVGAIVERSVAVFTVIKLAGAVYLVYLGVQALRHRSAGHIPAQMLLLGGVFLAIAMLCDSTWALVAGSARSWLARSPRRLELVGGSGGLVMIGIGASLAITGRKD